LITSNLKDDLACVVAICASLECPSCLDKREDFAHDRAEASVIGQLRDRLKLPAVRADDEID
jgi:hypothetical protein